MYVNFSSFHGMFKRKFKRSSTYEFETNGANYDIAVRSVTKPFLLALLFLLFNVKVSFLVIIIANFNASIVSVQAVRI